MGAEGAAPATLTGDLRATVMAVGAVCAKKLRLHISRRTAQPLRDDSAWFFCKNENLR